METKKSHIGMKEDVLNSLILEKRVQKAIAYLNSESGQKNWSLNIGRGYTINMNLVAAIQTATRCIKYESIEEILNEMDCRFDFISWTLHRKWCN